MIHEIRTCSLHPAGKSSTFKMLTGEVKPDRGDAVLGGSSITHATSAARQLLGYCPQFEAVPGAMTGREVLAMYGRWVSWGDAVCFCVGRNRPQVWETLGIRKPSHPCV